MVDVARGFDFNRTKDALERFGLVENGDLGIGVIMLTGSKTPSKTSGG